MLTCVMVWFAMDGMSLRSMHCRCRDSKNIYSIRKVRDVCEQLLVFLRRIRYVLYVCVEDWRRYYYFSSFFDFPLSGRLKSVFGGRYFTSACRLFQTCARQGYGTNNIMGFLVQYCTFFTYSPYHVW
jgi:hypothetical protein